MLATAPEVSQWWNSKGRGIEKSWNILAKLENGCIVLSTILAVFTMILFSIAFVAVIFDMNGWLPNEWRLVLGTVMLKLIYGLFASIGAILAFGIVGVCFQRYYDAKLHRHRVATADHWGFVLKLPSGCSHDKRLQVMEQLPALGVTSSQIIALRNLELPSSWWDKFHQRVLQSNEDQRKQCVASLIREKQ